MGAAWRLENPKAAMLQQARRRAREASVPFDISEDDFDIPLICPVLGIRLEKGTGKSGPNSPTLDRVIPHLGYVKGNVAVISHRANTIKHNASPHEIRKIYTWMLLRNMPPPLRKTAVNLMLTLHLHLWTLLSAVRRVLG